jgi:ribosomal protein L3 glutamine methyltransferase
MGPRRAAEPDRLAGAPRRASLGAWLRFAEGLYGSAGLALGQVSATAHDEALYLLLHTLGLPMDSAAAVLRRKLTAAEEISVRSILARRVFERVPAAYLTKEAWLGGHRFYVDERVIIPRSYFVEIIPRFLSGAPAPRKSPRRNPAFSGMKTGRPQGPIAVI